MPTSPNVAPLSFILASLLACFSLATSSSGPQQQSTGGVQTHPYGWTPNLQHGTDTNWEILLGPHAVIDSRFSALTQSHDIVSSQEAALQFQIEVLRRKLHVMRQQLGACQCQKNCEEHEHKVTENGGFCLEPVTSGVGVGMNHHLEKNMARVMAGYFNYSTVLDLGCGLGQYGHFFARQFARHNITWTGFDGSENVELVTSGFVKYMDLTKPQWLGTTYDWVVSLEVGEHIPAEFEDTFLQNIVRHASKGIVMSWAVPGQKGYSHVNNKDNSYIKERLRQLGFQSDEVMQAALRAAAKRKGWFAKTAMAFRRISPQA